MKILVTGGAGYIGSHTCLELLKAGYKVIVLDNLANSKEESLKRVEELAGKKLDFIKADLLNLKETEKVFEDFSIEAVIHFASFKAVGESVKKPLDYYRNNLTGTINLLDTMKKHNVKKLIFSSSCTVYGNPTQVPVTENSPVGQATCPYGWTKIMLEQILEDLYKSDPTWNITILRYFNPVGADSSGRIGEDPNGIPNNLFPFITQVTIGKRPELSVFGNHYPTPDGTCIRDYIHVTDLSLGHLKALEKLTDYSGFNIYNLGTGKGSSVLEVIAAFKKATGKDIPYTITSPRLGDIPETFADPSKAKKELGWETEKTLEDMCKDAWNFQSLNPNGYEESS